MIYIFIIALFVVLICSEVDVSGSPNVGTVLFTKHDVRNKTWPRNKLALLKARLYTQHLIPPFTPPQTPDFVDTLLTYFQDCYTVIRQESKDVETDQILTTAFTDVVGGYLKTFALPITKYGYYGGSLPKQDALKLFLFYEDVKNYLGKNDSGWAGPDLTALNAMTVSVALPLFSFTRRNSLPDPCLYLSYFQKTPRGLVIPTPVIDWHSHTMFVPLANQTLVSLYSANVNNALHKYYDIALNCVRSKRPSHLDSFNDRFQSWLKGDVVPHLNDDSLYAALQGVLSLVNTTNDLAAYTAYKDVMSPEPQKIEQKLIATSTYVPEISTKMLIILIIVALEILWCIPTLLCLLFRRRKKPRRSGISITSRINTILETRGNKKSESESCDLEEDTSNFHCKKRRGGLKFQMRPNSPVLLGEVYSSRTVCTAGTDTSGRRMGHRSDAATMVDEVPRKRSSKDTQTKLGKHITNRVSTLINTQNETWMKQIPSDGTSKTAVLSKHSPSKAATIRLSRRLQKPADASVESCAKDTRLPPCLACLSKVDTKKSSMELEAVVATASADAPVAQECPSKDAADAQNVAATDDVTVIKSVKKCRKWNKNLKVFEKKPQKPQCEQKPYLEIRIDRPHREISVDVTRNGDVKKVVKKAKKSKIPKRSMASPRVAQVAATGWKRPGLEELVSTHKSMIPKLKWATDDSALRRDVGTKSTRLNVTL